MNSREILSLKRRDDGVFEFYEDGELTEEWEVKEYDDGIWGWLIAKLLRHLKNIGEKRVRLVENANNRD